MEQFLAIEHGDTSLHDEEAVFSSDVQIGVELAKSITDNDGDSASDSESVNITGSIAFDDDGPKIIGDMVMESVDEADLAELVQAYIRVEQPRASGSPFDDHFFNKAWTVLVDGNPVSTDFVLGTGVVEVTVDGRDAINHTNGSGPRFFDVVFDVAVGSGVNVEFQFEHKVGPENVDASAFNPEGIKFDFYVDGSFVETLADFSTDSSTFGGTRDWAARSISDTVDVSATGGTSGALTATLDLSGRVDFGTDGFGGFALKDPTADGTATPQVTGVIGDPPGNSQPDIGRRAGPLHWL